MDTYHIAKLTQILGIIVGTGFGTILLNPAVVGRLADRINSRFLYFGDNLKERYETIVKKIPFFATESLLAAQVILPAWVLLTLSIERDIDWIYWTCIAILVIFALLAITNKLPQFLTNQPKYPKMLFPILIFFRLISSLIINPVIVYILSIVNLLVLVILFIFNAVARKDIVRRGLIIFGFICVLTGLFLEYFLVDQP